MPAWEKIRPRNDWGFVFASSGCPWMVEGVMTSVWGNWAKLWISVCNMRMVTGRRAKSWWKHLSHWHTNLGNRLCLLLRICRTSLDESVQDVVWLARKKTASVCRRVLLILPHMIAGKSYSSMGFALLFIFHLYNLSGCSPRCEFSGLLHVDGCLVF